MAGIRVTQSFGREAVNAGIFKRLAYDHSLYNLNFARQSGLFIPLLEVNTQFFIGAVLLAGGYGALQAGWEPGLQPMDTVIQQLLRFGSEAGILQ